MTCYHLVLSIPLLDITQCYKHSHRVETDKQCHHETDGLIDALLQSSTKSPEEIAEVLGVLSVALDGL